MAVARADGGLTRRGFLKRVGAGLSPGLAKLSFGATGCPEYRGIAPVDWDYTDDNYAYMRPHHERWLDEIKALGADIVEIIIPDCQQNEYVPTQTARIYRDFIQNNITYAQQAAQRDNCKVMITEASFGAIPSNGYTSSGNTVVNEQQQKELCEAFFQEVWGKQRGYFSGSGVMSRNLTGHFKLQIVQPKRSSGATTRAAELLGIGMLARDHGIYRKGELYPLKPLKGLKENTQVRLTVEPASGAPSALERFAGVLSAEEADEMLKLIEEEFERVEPDAW